MRVHVEVIQGRQQSCVGKTRKQPKPQMGYRVFQKAFLVKGSKRLTMQAQLGTSYIGPYDSLKG